MTEADVRRHIDRFSESTGNTFSREEHDLLTMIVLQCCHQMVVDELDKLRATFAASNPPILPPEVV